VNELVLVQGMDDTKAALRRWNERRWRTLLPWALLSLGIGIGLLFATWLVARNATPDLTPLRIPGYYSAARVEDGVHVLTRNALVLALHALACVAGFMAGSSLPRSAAQRSGIDRWVHEKAGPLAIGFVTLATLFSLVTQAYVIGNTASTVAFQVGITPAELLLVYSIHAIPELTALFLPLAAWLIASRSKRWDELLAATVVTVAVAIPVLLLSVALELWVTPEVLGWVAPESHAIWSQ